MWKRTLHPTSMSRNSEGNGFKHHEDFAVVSNHGIIKKLQMKNNGENGITGCDVYRSVVS